MEHKTTVPKAQEDSFTIFLVYSWIVHHQNSLCNWIVALTPKFSPLKQNTTAFHACIFSLNSPEPPFQPMSTFYCVQKASQTSQLKTPHPKHPKHPRIPNIPNIPVLSELLGCVAARCKNEPELDRIPVSVPKHPSSQVDRSNWDAIISISRCRQNWNTALNTQNRSLEIDGEKVMRWNSAIQNLFSVDL